jgi:hypothetical protein
MSTEIATGVAVGVMVLANAVVGISLLRTALRTRRAPELLIGMGLFGMGPVSQGLTAVAGTGRLPAGEVDQLLHALAAVGSAVGMACIYGFVLTVFRPRVAWARAFTTLAVVTLVVASAGSVTALSLAPPDAPSAEVLHGWGVVILGAFTLAFGWAALESGSYYLRARKRIRLGLIDAGVTNRFLLWAIASGSAFLLGVCLMMFQLEGQQLTGSLLPSLLIMCVSVITGVTMYLAFLPPRAYLAWVQRGAGAGQAA